MTGEIIQAVGVSDEMCTEETSLSPLPTLEFKCQRSYWWRERREEQEKTVVWKVGEE